MPKRQPRCPGGDQKGSGPREATLESKTTVVTLALFAILDIAAFIGGLGERCCYSLTFLLR